MEFTSSAQPGMPTGQETLAPQRALQHYLAEHYQVLLTKLARHLGCADMAGECLHDTWLRLDRADLGTQVLNAEAYVYRMACNVATDRIRRDRPWQYVADAEMALETLVAFAPGPEQVASDRSELRAIDRALAQLPSRHQGILRAVRVDAMPREEVARRYGVSPRTVDLSLQQSVAHCGGVVGRAAWQQDSRRQERTAATGLACC